MPQVPAERAPSAAGAFTLLELILVLVIVATLLSVSTASLRGLHASHATRAAAEHFMSVCQQARNRAVIEATAYRVTLDLEGRSYRLMRQGNGGYEPTHTEIGRRFELDERFTLTCEGLAMDAAEAHIDFFPDGRSQPFRVIFRTASESVAVARRSMSDPIRIE